jgi:hypothetical protein
MEVMAEERRLAPRDPIWQARHDRHYQSVEAAMDELIRRGANVATEGDTTLEDAYLSCSALQLAMFALLQTDPARRRKYTDAALIMTKMHRCLSQILIPDSRMNGAALRYWEAPAVEIYQQFMNSPHGWSVWRIYGLWYLYLLTGEEEWLRQTMNALGSCVQLVDFDSGKLRWGFVPDPYIHATMLVEDGEHPGRGEYVSRVIGEQYIDRTNWWVSGPQWRGVSEEEMEVFKALEECALCNAYVVERPEGSIVAWNCRVQEEGNALVITPAEEIVSRVHLNLRNKRTVTATFKDVAVSGEFVGMQWIGPGGVPQQLR